MWKSCSNTGRAGRLKIAVVAGSPTAVHYEDVPCEVGVFRGRQKKCGVRDLLRLAGAPQRDVVDEGLHVLMEKAVAAEKSFRVPSVMIEPAAMAFGSGRGFAVS